jgi:D-alanyl-lipoteichoic acid acyltransferase DltB (MBOAT superfamily)
MLFNSLEFAIFFPIVAILYFWLPQRLRTVHLLVASCIFYMAFIPAYILILALTIVIDYFAGLWIERSEGPRRKRLLVVSIVATCLVLAVFKYFYFFTENFVGFVGLFGWQLTGPTIDIILPIGLSFHTFQSLSYVIEVYRRQQKAESNFITYATYVMFFPQLVAGPIERPQNLLHQFHEHHRFEYERVVSGLKRMAWGFFKKLVIADRLALYVNDVYAAPDQATGLQLTLATVFFAYQIYCDFSGYSDIAIGSARVLGFKLMENFDRPYASRSISEFWTRWHISLSSWFRDYVYIPLGGNRVSRARHYGNLLFTFSISGLWHGAAWTYVVWGTLNGVYLILGQAKGSWSQRIAEWAATSPGAVPSALRWLSHAAAVVTTFALVCIGWIFFRAQSLADAWYILTHLTVGWDLGRIGTEQFLLRQLPLAIGSIAVLEVLQYLHSKRSLALRFSVMPLPLRWTGYVTMVLAVAMLGVYRKTEFIYFQF